MPSAESNRRNALKSTGPRTKEGKAASRLNRLSHGAFAADLLLPGEDAAAFRALEASFHDLYRPATPTEEALVKRIVLAAWRLDRLAAMECRVLRSQADSAISTAALFHRITDEMLASGEPRPYNGPGDVIADAWIRDANSGNTIVKLSRYQNALERSFYRALHEFRRLRTPAPGTPEINYPG